MFEPGETHGRPENASPAWARDALREVHRAHGAVLITFLLDDGHGTQVSGNLTGVGIGTDWDDEFESAYLDPLGDSDDPREIPCREIVAFRIREAPQEDA
jgi:hypothetical protein